MEIIINKMQLSDLNQIQDCLIQDFDDFWSFSMLQQELQNAQNLNSQYFVAKIEDEIVGFIGLLTIVDEVNIMNVVVKKNKRHLGIGSLLLEKAISYSKELNCTSITLEVNVNNIPAIKLYKKYNFEQVGLRKKYYNNTDDAILLTLNI